MIETKEILEQAEKFYKTAKYCIGEDYNNGWYVGKKELSTEEACKFLFPKDTVTATVNISFCCELLLKSLLNQGDIIKGHDLKELFYKLDESWKKIIINKMGYENQEKQFDFFLSEISNCFEKWRYIYEYTPEERSIYFSGLNNFATALMVVAHGKYYYENSDYDKIKEEDLNLIYNYLNEE